MAGFKIIHNKPECIGCGACVAVCPEYWEMGDDGLSHLKGSKEVGEKEELVVKKVGCNQEAADVCPVQIIKIVKA